MKSLTKKYRLIWITSKKEIINNYKTDYNNSVTQYPSPSTNSYFESDNYQDILDKITSEGLKETHVRPPHEN